MRASGARGHGCARSIVLALALLGSTADFARAQASSVDASAVELSIPDCAGISGAEIAKLVALELAPRQRVVTAGSAEAGIRATVACAATRATITVEDARHPSPLVLVLELFETKPEARPRFLALAVAELIATSGLEPGEARASVRVAERRAPAVAEPVRDLALRRFELGVQARAARAFQPALFAPAAMLAFARRFSIFSIGGDLGYERARLHTQSALVTAQDLALSVAPAWHLSGARLDLGLALGLRAGYAWLDASPRGSQLIGRELSGLFVGVVTDASLSVRVSPWIAPRIGLEVGYVVKPLRGFDADHAPLLALRGLSLGAIAGVVFYL